MNALGKTLVAFVLVTGLVILGSGAYLIVERETGTRATATVTNCVRDGRAYDCSGSWILGGSQVASGGDLVVGTVVGADPSDVGKTIDVTVSGGTAYTRSLGLPIILIVLGLLLATLTALALFGAGRRA